ncbi:PREDICTED: ankyrin repeat domain-containing protein SOWAHA-like isoform X2 [Cyprinodon variegatus]|uniref:ankyrin repeat domain-containing protein SOWAHA-like isoform X2 n=1 Tax=Cyprinodon variegatus TaxID=28743 RepID=UPI000742988A|nr:PREDICTED: ankyrin repeat domain-containing protein SOWAHA-like isoform X2 [Cyprinodon variegatus]
MGDVSEESLLDYFYSAGGNSGRVRNADILKTFKPFIGHSEPQLRAKYREEFKLIIDRIAVVKSENGEKYLILKKKYRHLMQERETKHHGPDGEPERRQSPATAEWDTQTASTCKKEEQEEPMSCGEHEEESESEHDEESTGSMGSTSVALDPTEKEWIYHAASARVPDLSQLLRLEPSLVNKKDFTSFTALHWAAKHGNKDMATLVADAGGDVNNKSHGGYTPLHIAALHGHRHIVDLLIGTYGAKENVRDYSGRLPFHYLSVKDLEGPQEDCDLQFQVAQARERNKNRKLVSLFHSKKKWGSAEELAPIEEERTASHQLSLPPFRPRKFSR